MNKFRRLLFVTTLTLTLSSFSMAGEMPGPGIINPPPPPIQLRQAQPPAEDEATLDNVEFLVWILLVRNLNILL
jgi:hypothetical protein